MVDTFLTSSRERSRDLCSTLVKDYRSICQVLNDNNGSGVRPVMYLSHVVICSLLRPVVNDVAIRISLLDPSRDGYEWRKLFM